MAGFTERSHAQDGAGNDSWFPWVLSAHTLVVVVLMGVLLRSPEESDEVTKGIANNEVGTYYMFYSHVCIMIFVGFGFLMTFLKRYNYSAVSYNFMLSCFVFLWNMFASHFWAQLQAGNGLHSDHLGMETLIEGLFGAGAVMISFGAVLGKTTPSQLIIIGFWEVIFYSLNFMVGAIWLKATDAGGSIFIHTFGAYFGVALAYVMSPKDAAKIDHPYNGPSYTSDMHSMIGTIFLWIYWPSFNAAVAGDGHQLRAIVNTSLSLSGSCLAAFVASYILVHARVGWQSDRKFDMVHIQNATLAGGVAMGSSANFALNPAAAVCIGIAAGFLSTYGYHAITPKLQSALNIDDTCGVHNLHGMPGIFAVIVSVFALLAANSSTYPLTWRDIVADARSSSEQAGVQLIALGITLAMALAGGVITGKIAKMLPSPAYPLEAYGDHTMWEVPDDYVNAGQAHEGERALTPRSAARKHLAAFPGVGLDEEVLTNPVAMDAEAGEASPAADAAGEGKGEAAAEPAAETVVEVEEEKAPADE